MPAPLPLSSMDTLVAKLWDECEFFYSIVSNKQLLLRHTQSLQRVPSVIPIAFATSTSSSSSSSSSSATHAPTTFSDEGDISHSTISPSSSPLPESICSSCSIMNKNQKCTLELCLNCCARSTSYCRVPRHREAKEHFVNNPHRTLIDSCVINYNAGLPRQIEINYTHGTNAGEWRIIIPCQWTDNRKTSFFAFHENIEKQYIIERVTGSRNA